MHLKIYTPPFNKYGYVIFSKDSIFSFSENSDYIKIYKTETSWVSIVFNPLNSKEFYIIDSSNNAEINDVKFHIKRIERDDTLFFESHIVSGAQAYILKYPYVSVTVEGYLRSVFFTNYGEKYLNKVELQ